MLGAKLNAERFGTIYFHLLFLMKERQNFDSNSEYFLGPIVTFRNEDKLEVIDGQSEIDNSYATFKSVLF